MQMVAVDVANLGVGQRARFGVGDELGDGTIAQPQIVGTPYETALVVVGLGPDTISRAEKSRETERSGVRGRFSPAC